MPRISSTGTTHVLPFAYLSPQDFERLCFWLLRSEGYTDVAHVGAAGSDRGCDISARKDGRRCICQCKRVRQFGPYAAKKEVEAILAWPASQRPDDLLFLVTCNVSHKTRSDAQALAGSMLCHFWPLTDLDQRVKAHSDILAEFFQPSRHAPDPYFARFGFAVPQYLRVIRALLQRDRVQEFSVPLSAILEVDEHPQSVDAWSFVTGWVSRPKGTHLAVLGDYGTGKSWLCLLLANHLGDAFRKAPSVQPLPLLLNFKSYKAGMKLDDLIPATMARDYGLTHCDTYKIQEAIRKRSIILILDGLDEMVRELGQRDALVQFARLNVPRDARALVTCRTHYFLSGTEQREVLNPQMSIPLPEAPPSFEILHLRLLDRSRSEEAIRRRAPRNERSRVIGFVRSTYNLPELCARPILLSLVCQSYEALTTISGEITSAELYDSYLTTWLSRELRSGRLSIRPDDILRFLEQLAEVLIRHDSVWVSSSEFRQRVLVFANELILCDVDAQVLTRQLTTSTFLTRTAGDGWEFVHRSLQEYLYARRFFRWERETNGEGDFPVTHVPAWQFVSQIVQREWNESKALKWIVERVPRDQEPSLCKTTLRAAAAYWLLRHGSRRAAEYPLRGIMLDWVDLRRLDFSKADLTRADLRRSDLRATNLRGAILRDALLAGADFSDADLTAADLRGADCSGTRFVGSVMHDVRR